MRETRCARKLRVRAMIAMEDMSLRGMCWFGMHTSLTQTLTLASTITFTATRNVALALTLDPDP
jgi:hypothetical protein